MTTSVAISFRESVPSTLLHTALRFHTISYKPKCDSSPGHTSFSLPSSLIHCKQYNIVKDLYFITSSDLKPIVEEK